MEKQFVTYEIALKLKELGFDEECLAYYTSPSQNEVYLDKDGEKTRFCLLSRKISGELKGQGSVRNYLFQWLLDNDKTSGELHTLAHSVTAPLWQQVIDWFIDKYDIHISLEPIYKPQQFQNLMYCYAISTKENFYGGIDDNLDNWIGLNDGGNMFHIENSRYKAREQAILKAIELCQNKK